MRGRTVAHDLTPVEISEIRRPATPTAPCSKEALTQLLTTSIGAGGWRDRAVVQKGEAEATADRVELRCNVEEMYEAVAENPHGEFHFELESALAERLG